MNLPLYLTGLGLVLLSMVGLLVVVRRRGRSLPAADVEEQAEVQAVVEPLLAEPHPDVRALRAQVRVLEEALERAAESTLEQPDLASYRAQVRIAVESVARRTSADADPLLVAARVSAAVARLDAAPAARVTLPVPLRRPVATAPVVTVTPPALEITQSAPVDDSDIVDREPVAEPVVVEEEVVLPVPPPATDVPRRSKRRSRRSAA
ncbi:hypothetical protein [Nocardioides sp. URHA0032]|uniref:hypothetical protein n=1 Tax=Nocardioides sp. URHA0032 TaxID=1380388 RepID=UPI0012DD40C4|nr:hypothetical protein [Nocardioides sp. URHA0032]